MTLQEKREAIIDHYLKTLSDDELRIKMGYTGGEYEYIHFLRGAIMQRRFNRNILHLKLTTQILDSEIENLYKDVASKIE